MFHRKDLSNGFAVVTMFATRNKCIATRSKGLTSSNKKLLGFSAVCLTLPCEQLTAGR